MGGKGKKTRKQTNRTDDSLISGNTRRRGWSGAATLIVPILTRKEGNKTMVVIQVNLNRRSLDFILRAIDNRITNDKASQFILRNRRRGSEDFVGESWNIHSAVALSSDIKVVILESRELSIPSI